MHSDENEVDLGSNTENLLRLAPCNVLLTGGKFYPPLDVKAEEIISWTEEAEARMERVPPQVKGVARTALLRYAIEQGHTVITNKVIDEAMAIFMPTRMAEKMQILAEDLAVAQAPRGEPGRHRHLLDLRLHGQGPQRRGDVPGVQGRRPTSSRSSPGRWWRPSPTQEGGIEEEESMPGVQVKWSADARDALREVTDAYLRRRAKARVEKYARSQQDPGHHLPARAADDRGDGGPRQARRRLGHAARQDEVRARPSAGAAPTARDAPSPFTWTEDATARLNRVPAGFMRDMTREEVEKVAAEQGRDHHRSGRLRGGHRARAARR